MENDKAIDKICYVASFSLMESAKKDLQGQP